jgi:DNA-binding CsgD family transcriptional regulator
MPDYGEPLTDREEEILKILATGATNRQVGHQLHISTNTVKVHLRNIFAKLGAESRTEATMIAIREGLIQVGQEAGVDTLGDAALRTSLDTTRKREIEPPLPWSERASLLGTSLMVVMAVMATGPRDASQPQSQADLPLDQPSSVGAPLEPHAASDWEELAQMPSRRAHLATAVSGGQIIAIGGSDPEGTADAVEIYDPTTDTWSTGARKPAPAAYIQAAYLEPEIYVPGGCDEGGQPIRDVDVYNAQTDSWRRGAPIPEGRCAYALASLGDALFLYGGWDGERYVSTSFAFDRTRETWDTLSPVPDEMGFASAVAWNDHIYVVGGYDGQRELVACRVYDPASDSWESCAPMALGRGGLGVGVVGNQIYAIGGGGWTTYLGFNERYSPAEDLWSTIQTPVVGEWRNPGVVALENDIIAVGGWSDGQLGLNQKYAALPFRVFIPVSQQ